MFYWFSFAIATILVRILWGIRVTGRENLPRSGGYILAANHASYLDPPVVGISTPRQVYFMAKKELFEMPVLGKIIAWQEAFPVERGTADRRAIRRALDLLRKGKVLGIFPEGTRSATGELLEPEPGFALIAMKAGTPIVPVGIIGTLQIEKSRYRPRVSRIEVRFGTPILPQESGGKADKERLLSIARRVMQAIGELLEGTASGIGRQASGVGR